MPPHVTSVLQAETLLLDYSPLKMDGESYTLERMEILMARLGNPQNSLRVIHVAGTSGKTSSAYFIRNLLEQLGKKTGLTASPHINSITERVQINGQPLVDEQFVSYLNEFLLIIEEWPEIKPTYFELLIAFAYWVFAKEQVEYAVVEVGLGGLFDATNVVSRTDKVCALTPIGLDHTQVLGDTLTEIAYQKAGIITAHNHVFSARQADDIMGVFNAVIHRNNAVMHDWEESGSNPTHLPIFQRENWRLASQVVAYLIERDCIMISASYNAELASYKTPPGRYEKYQLGEKTIILDGAHNPQKLQALRQSLQHEYKNSISVLAGFIEAPDDKIDACLDELKHISDTVCFTQFIVGQDIKHRKSVPAVDLQLRSAKRGLKSTVRKDLQKAVTELLNQPEAILVITGSLYLVAAARGALQRKVAP